MPITIIFSYNSSDSEYFWKIFSNFRRNPGRHALFLDQGGNTPHIRLKTSAFGCFESRTRVSFLCFISFSLLYNISVPIQTHTSLLFLKMENNDDIASEAKQRSQLQFGCHSWSPSTHQDLHVFYRCHDLSLMIMILPLPWSDFSTLNYHDLIKSGLTSPSVLRPNC